MKNKVFLLAVALAPVLATAHTAFANDAPAAPAGKAEISARIGLTHPASGSTRDLTGSGFGAGLSYTLAKRENSDVRVRFDLDYADASRDGYKAQPISVLANAIKPLGSDADKGAYVGAGVGIVHNKVSSGATPFGDLAANSSESKTTLGGQALIGYNLSKRFFGEAAYHLNEHTAAIDTSYFGVSVGARF